MIRVVITYGNDRNVITVKNALKIDTEQPINVMTVKMNSSETSKTWNKANGIVTSLSLLSLVQTNCCNSRLKKRTPNHLVIVKPRWSTFSNSTLIINARNTLNIYNSILCLLKFVVPWTEEQDPSDEIVPNLFFYAHEYCVVGHVIAMALGKSVVTVKYTTATSGPFPKLWA